MHTIRSSIFIKGNMVFQNCPLQFFFILLNYENSLAFCFFVSVLLHFSKIGEWWRFWGGEFQEMKNFLECLPHFIFEALILMILCNLSGNREFPHEFQRTREEYFPNSPPTAFSKKSWFLKRTIIPCDSQ